MYQRLSLPPFLFLYNGLTLFRKTCQAQQYNDLCWVSQRFSLLCQGGLVMHIFPRCLRLRFRGNTLPFLLSLRFRHFFHSILQTCITLQVFFLFFYDLRHIIGGDVQNTPIFDSVKKIYCYIYLTAPQNKYECAFVQVQSGMAFRVISTQ